MLQYLFYRTCQLIIHCVPTKQAYGFARWLSDMHFYYSRRDREAVISNLKQITGSDEDLELMAREVFRNFGRYLVDFFFMYRVNERFVEERVIIKRKEQLERAKAYGKGVIILTAHIGNWEMGAAIMSHMGNKLTVIALPHKQRSVNDLFNRQREKHGVQVVPTSVAIRRCLEALHNGECVALLGDRDFGSFGESLDFLGRKTSIPKGAAFFAAKTGAVILPSFIIPNRDGTYTLHFKDLILPPQGRGKDPDEILLTVMRYTRVIEDVIKEYPTQWLMFREFGIDNEHMYPDPRT